MAAKEKSTKGKKLNHVLSKISVPNKVAETKSTSKKNVEIQCTEVETGTCPFTSPTRLIIRTGLESNFSLPYGKFTDHNSVFVLDNNPSYIKEWRRCQMSSPDADLGNCNQSSKTWGMDSESSNPGDCYSSVSLNSQNHAEESSIEARRSVLDAYLYSDNPLSDDEEETTSFSCGRNQKDTCVVVHQEESLGCVCNICRKSFTTKKSLKRHQKTVHKNDTTEHSFKSSTAFPGQDKLSAKEPSANVLKSKNKNLQLSTVKLKDSLKKKTNHSVSETKPNAEQTAGNAKKTGKASITAKTEAKSISKATVSKKNDMVKGRVELDKKKNSSLKRGQRDKSELVPFEKKGKHTSKEQCTEKKEKQTNKEKDLKATKDVSKSNEIKNQKSLSTENAALPTKLSMPMPFNCSRCQMGFKTLNSLTRHLPTHTITRYHCHKCSEVFLNMRSLTKHLLSHEDDLPVKDVLLRCRVCSQGFKNKRLLKEHSSTHSAYKEPSESKIGLLPKQTKSDSNNLQDFHCKTCNLDFTSRTNFKEHITDKHVKLGDTSLQCEKCGEICTSNQGIISHLMEAHHVSRREARAIIRKKASDAVSIGVSASISKESDADTSSAVTESEDHRDDLNSGNLARPETLPIEEVQIFPSEHESESNINEISEKGCLLNVNNSLLPQQNIDNDITYENAFENPTKNCLSVEPDDTPHDGKLSDKEQLKVDESLKSQRSFDEEIQNDDSQVNLTDSCFLEEQESKRILEALFIEVDEENSDSEDHEMIKDHSTESSLPEQQTCAPGTPLHTAKKKNGSSTELVTISRHNDVGNHCKEGTIDKNKTDNGYFGPKANNQADPLPISLSSTYDKVNVDSEDDSLVKADIDDDEVVWFWKTEDSHSHSLETPTESQERTAKAGNVTITDLPNGIDSIKSSDGALFVTSGLNSLKYPAVGISSNSHELDFSKTNKVSIAEKSEYNNCTEQRRYENSIYPPLESNILKLDHMSSNQSSSAGSMTKISNRTEVKNSSLNEVASSTYYSRARSISRVLTRNYTDGSAHSDVTTNNIDSSLSNIACSADNHGLVSNNIIDGLSMTQNSGSGKADIPVDYITDQKHAKIAMKGKQPPKDSLSSLIYVRRKSAIASEKKIHASTKSKKVKDSTVLKSPDKQTRSESNELENQPAKKLPVEITMPVESRKRKSAPEPSDASARKKIFTTEESATSVFTCKECNKVYATQKILDRHALNHKMAALQCPLCPKSYSRKDTLTKHLKTQHGNAKLDNKPNHVVNDSRPMNGDASPSAKHKHATEHSKTNHKRLSLEQNEKLECGICHKTFSTRHSLKTHNLRLHGSQTTFKCEICNCTFLQLKTLNFHKLKHDEESV